jgi:hypothetical protein
MSLFGEIEEEVDLFRVDPCRVLFGLLAGVRRAGGDI